MCLLNDSEIPTGSTIDDNCLGLILNIYTDDIPNAQVAKLERQGQVQSKNISSWKVKIELKCNCEYRMLYK